MSDLIARIKPKKSSTPGEIPAASDLEVAEVAINTADGKLFTKHTDGTVRDLSVPQYQLDQLPRVKGSSSQADSSVTTSLTVPAPLSDSGDKVYYIIMHREPGGTLTAPPELTHVSTHLNVAPLSSSGPQHLELYERISEGSFEPSEYVWTQPNSARMAGVAFTVVNGDYSSLTVTEYESTGQNLSMVTRQDSLNLVVSTWFYGIGASDAFSLTGSGVIQTVPSPETYPRINAGYTTQGGGVISTIESDDTREPPNHGGIVINIPPVVNSINDLSDVDTFTNPPSNGDALVWNGANGVWEPGAGGGGGGGSSNTYALGAVGTSAYTFTGPGLDGTEENPDIYVIRGATYTFQNGLGAHPFQLQSTAGQGGTVYNNGVTGSPALNGELVWVVPMDAPAGLFYQSTTDASMGGSIFVSGSGGASSLDDLTDVSYDGTTGLLEINGLDEISFEKDVPNGYKYNVYVNPTYGIGIGSYLLGTANGSNLYVHYDKGIDLKTDVDGQVNISVNGANGSSTPELRFNSGNPTISSPTGNYLGLKLPSGYSTDQTYVLPPTDGSNGQVLATDGNGNTAWITGGGELLADLTPQLGGNLDVNGFYIYNSGTGPTVIGGGTSSSLVEIKSGSGPAGLALQSEVDADTVTLTLPAGGVSPYEIFLPSANGVENDKLRLDGSGNLQWVQDSVDSLSDTLLTSPTQNQVLTYNGFQWVNAAPTGSGAGAITQGVEETLASTVGNPNLNYAALGYTGNLVSVESDADCWLVIYTSDAARTADSSRAFNTDPVAGSGVIAEFLLTAGTPIEVTPATAYFNSETPAQTYIYASARSTAGTAVAANVTIKGYAQVIVDTMDGGTFGSG